MIVEMVALGSITLTYKPPEPPPVEVGYLAPRVELIEPLPPADLEEIPTIAPKLSTGSVQSPGNLYEPGQCVWYIKNLRPEIPNSWGNATDWLFNAQQQGWATGLEPRVGAVGWTNGHVVLVTTVNDNGTVDITDMNGRYVPFEIGNRTFPASKYVYIY